KPPRKMPRGASSGQQPVRVRQTKGNGEPCSGTSSYLLRAPPSMKSWPSTDEIVTDARYRPAAAVSTRRFVFIVTGGVPSRRSSRRILPRPSSRIKPRLHSEYCQYCRRDVGDRGGRVNSGAVLEVCAPRDQRVADHNEGIA